MHVYIMCVSIYIIINKSGQFEQSIYTKPRCHTTITGSAATIMKCQEISLWENDGIYGRMAMWTENVELYSAYFLHTRYLWVLTYCS